MGNTAKQLSDGESYAMHSFAAMHECSTETLREAGNKITSFESSTAGSPLR